ncbi:uncharacterized protein LOC124271708 isoform X2 [Haliotis rubra]|nr:uncharacterized protein LOC124271708 isoform X2 [Haliotis rubra]XP_046562826.1 uncharacterized protein LOC124271708 isoform X2 [Haliotis rubra]XP_046562827.1 uncharacterized protein LOC124271708 isoform X2 [Haliotis rubra]XP_046562828.1 uncharacterized protein LOC124271708 isoform X2 [Haliotis rubra]XP_046562829.1 uncharacterized protein LOC124271708 isoform X2 [Haliotis rubra]
MYNHKEQGKGIPPLAMGMVDQRKAQYPGYPIQQPHPETASLSRGTLVPGVTQSKIVPPLAYASTQGHNSTLTSQSSSLYYYGNSVSSEASSRFPRSHSGHSGTVQPQSLSVNSAISAESQNHVSSYGGGSIQNGLPLTSRPERVPPLTTVGYPSLGQQRVQSSQLGAIDSGLISGYPSSIQTGIPQSGVQNRGGLTGVFKLKQSSDYRQHIHEAATVDKHSSVPSPRSSGSVYPGSVAMGYQTGSSISQSPKQSGYPHSSAVTPASQTMKMPMPVQSSSIQSAMHAMSRHSPIRQGYQGQSNQYGPLQSPTGSQQRQVLSESGYGIPRSTIPMSYSQTSGASSEALRRSNQMPNTPHSSHHHYNPSSQHAPVSHSGDKRHSVYSVPSNQSARPLTSSQGVSVRGQDYPPRRTETKEPPVKHVMQPVKSGSIQTGMPLDLTSVDNSLSARVASESPLDLSVKTRKRCVDTAIDYGLSETDNRGVPPMKKPCVKADIPVDLRSKEVGSKVLMTAPAPQRQKYTYDIETDQMFDIKLQQNICQSNVYMKGNKYAYQSQRHVQPKVEHSQPKTEQIQNIYYPAHDSNVSQVEGFQNQGPVKSPLRLQPKYEEQKTCYPSPPEINAYPSQIPQKTTVPHLHVSSQSVVYAKATGSYADASDYRRAMSYSQNTSSSYGIKNDIHTTNSYQKPVSSYISSQTSHQRQPGSQSSVSSSSNHKSQPHHPIYPSMQKQQHQQHQQQHQQQLLHQRSLQQHQLMQHPMSHHHQQPPPPAQQQQQLQQQQQQPQRPPQNQYYSKPTSQSTIASPLYSQSMVATKSAFYPQKKEEQRSVDSRYHESIRSHSNVTQTKPSYEMKLPSSNGYIVTTHDKRNVPKSQVISTTLYKPPVSEQQEVQRPEASQTTPEIQITGVTAAPSQKSQPQPAAAAETQKDEQMNMAKYTEPLTIAIPTSTSNSDQSQKPAPKSVPRPGPHKILSKKHRILNAFGQDEDQKRVATHVPSSIPHHVHRTMDGVFKMPTISPSSPASPKMPILSPHDKIPPPEDASLHNEPPQLDPPATPVKNRLVPGAVGVRGENIQRAQQGDKAVKEKDGSKILLKPPAPPSAEATADGQVRPGEKYVRPEIMRRNSLPERPSMYQKNIPVANVAPFVHSNKDQIGVHSDSTQVLPEDSLNNESSSSQGVRQDKESSNTRNGNKQSKSTPTKKQKQDSTKASQKRSSQYIRKIAKLSKTTPRKKELKFLAAPLKYKLLKATTEIHEMEEASLVRNYKKQGLRPRQKQVPVKKPPKAKRKQVRISKKDKLLEEAGDSEGFEVDKHNTQKEIIAEPTKKKETTTVARQERPLRRAVIKIDRIEDSADSRLRLEQPPSPTRRTLSNLSRRAQELKRKAIDGPRRRGTRRRPIRAPLVHCGFTDFQPLVLQTRTRNRCTGRRRVTQYNRNAAYEKELRKDESRRALNRAKRRARLRRVTRQDTSYPEDEEYDDEDDDDTDGCWEISKSSQRQTVGRSKGGLMMKLYYRSGQDTLPTRGRRARHVQEFIGPDCERPSTKQSRGKARPRGKMKNKGKFQSQFEQFLRQDLGSEGDLLDDSFAHFGDDEESTTYLVQSDDPNGGVVSYPIPPEMKKLAINKNSGETLLHRAARLGYEDVALYCIRTHTVQVNARDNAGYTALHESCVKGNINVARHLIEHGADVNCCSQDGIRPIHDAVENDHLEIVRLLLSCGADPSIATYGGKTPIKISHSPAMTTLLKGYFGDINGFDSENEETPWEFAGTSISCDAAQGKGFDIFADVPSDPEDETDDLFDVEMTSAIRTYDLHLESADRLDRYVCVRDAMADFRMSKDDMKKICGNKIQLHKISAGALCKSTEHNVLTFCHQNVSPVELMNFRDYNTLEPKMIEHLKKSEDSTKAKKAKPKKRPSTPSKKSRKTKQLVESSDNESDATIEFGSPFNSDDESVDYMDLYSFNEFEPETTNTEQKKPLKFTPKQELCVQLKKETFPRVEAPKARRKSTENTKTEKHEQNSVGKPEVRHPSKPSLSHSSKSDSNVLFKTKLTNTSKSKSDPSQFSGKSLHSSKMRIRENTSIDATKASMKAQSEHIYSFDEHDNMLSAGEDTEISFPRIDRLFSERGDKHGLRKERSVDCKKGLEKSFRTIMSNSKEDHFRFKIGTISQDSHENPRGFLTGSDTPDTLQGPHNFKNVRSQAAM